MKGYIMKKISFVLALCLLVSMTACGSENTESAASSERNTTAATTTVATTTDTEAVESKMTTTITEPFTPEETVLTEETVPTESVLAETEGNPLEVDKGLFTVDLTIPASMIEDLEATKKEAEENEAVLDYKVNGDGSVTYTYKKSEYDKLVAEMRSGFDTMVDEKLTSGDFTTLVSIVGDDNLRNITLTVTNEADYGKTWDGLIIVGLYMYAGYHQIISGDAKKEEDIKTTFHFVDSATGTEFNTTVYPDQLMQE